MQDRDKKGKTYYRGERETQSGEIFISDSREVAANFGEVIEIDASRIPTNLYVVDDKVTLGYELDLIKNAAEENQVAFSFEFDKIVKKILQKKGYAGIKYISGTFDAEEIHLFNGLL